MESAAFLTGDGAQVNVGRGELLDQRAQGVGFGQSRDLVAELEVIEDVLHIGRKPVEVGCEVGRELLAIGAGSEVAQGELGCVVEGLFRRLAQGGILFDYAGLIERQLHVQDGLFAVFQNRIEPAQHGHRQDHVAVLAPHVQVAQDVVGDAPNVIRNPVQVPVAHSYVYPFV